MDLQAVLAWGGSGLLLILSLVKIPKLEINIWGLLGKAIGRSLNKELTQQISDIQKDIEDNNAAIKKLEDTLSEHCEADQENIMRNARSQILRFNDEILHNQKHSQEHFNEIIEMIDSYEKYSISHPKFPNNKAKMSIQNIKDEYNKCVEQHLFL